MTEPRRVSMALLVVGAALALIGIGMWSIPAALICAGVAIAAGGLFLIDVGGPK